MTVPRNSGNNQPMHNNYRKMVEGTDFELKEDYEVESVEDEQPNMGWMLARELIETVVLSLIIFLLIRQVVQNYRIESHSMEPNFYEGQFVLVNKLAYRIGSPSRGDVIVFRNPYNTDEDYIKRVIALPGDTIEIRNQDILINGVVQKEPYPQNMLLPNTYFGPVQVPPDHLFVMGDNRPNSRDSRSFGALPEDLVIGKTWVRVFPFSDFGPIAKYDLQPNAVAEEAP